jgi:murein DD-endopeptidase MepM/ murein hydrolase activator NlpD
MALALVLPACGGPTEAQRVIPDRVDCTLFPESRLSAYVVPFAIGARWQVSRTFSHYLASNGGVGLYAIDIIMPIGTPIHAIRAGRVVAVEERFADTDTATYHENWVMIRHADSTVARYIHLTPGGALVDVGDVVRQGQRVALSGNSGSTGGPHLHLDVQRCGPNLPPNYNRRPCGYTVPLSFRNTAPEGCGLRDRQWYAALPFTPVDE